MSILFAESFLNLDTTAVRERILYAGSQTATFDTTTPFPGDSGCLAIGYTTDVWRTFAPIGGGVSEVWGATWYRPPGVWDAAAGDIFEWRENGRSGDQHISIQSLDPGTIRVFRGTADSVQISTAPSALANGKWSHVECHVVFAASTGLIEVWVAGSQIVNLSGINTLSTNGSTGLSGLVDTWQCDGMSNEVGDDITRFAHLVIQDGSGVRLGPHRMFDALPSGDSTAAPEWVASSTTSTGNYLMVDDTDPDQDGTYVEASTDGQRDRYTITAPDFTGEAFAVVVSVDVKVAVPGPNLIKVGLRSSGGSESLSTGQVPAVAQYAPAYHHILLNPADSNPFEQADIAGSEIVIELSS